MLAVVVVGEMSDNAVGAAVVMTKYAVRAIPLVGVVVMFTVVIDSEDSVDETIAPRFDVEHGWLFTGGSSVHFSITFQSLFNADQLPNS